MDKKLLLFMAAVIAAITIMTTQYRRIQELKAERDKYKGNTEALFSDVEKYKVRDSLNAARVQSMELSIKEFQRFRAEDAALIKEMQCKNRELSEVNKAQAQTIIELRTAPKDTIIKKDSIDIPALALRCGDAWYDFEGLLAEGEFTGTLKSRDSLLIAETVRYKRFLGFLWKTRKVKDRRVDAVSTNPHPEILGLECVVIEN